MSAIFGRLQQQLGKFVGPDVHWHALLEEVRLYSDKVEREIRSLQADRERLLVIMNVIPVAFFVKDAKSRFFLMNRACEEQWGMSFDDLRDTDAGQFFPPDQMEQFLAKDRAVFEGGQPVEFEETFWSAGKQSNRIGHTFKRPMYDADGKPQYLVCVTLDITERKLAEAALVDSEARLRDTILNSPNPMMMHAEDGAVLMVSAALTAITGYRREDIPTIAIWTEKAFGPLAAKAKARVASQYRLTAIRDEGLLCVTTASGESRWWEAQSQPLSKLPDGRRVVLSLAVDVTERKRMQEELRALATTDSLTGLPNRREFMRRMEHELSRAKRVGGLETALLMIDLDHFKHVNDLYGHAAGDKMLIHFADLMRQNLRRIDSAGRLGGEEFAMLLPASGLSGAAMLAERLRAATASTPLLTDGATVPLTVSIGVAAFSPDDASVEAVLGRADAALYRAKDNGRNRVERAAEPVRTARKDPVSCRASENCASE